jgi:uncharacterized protein YbbC (DUF1343 family)
MTLGELARMINGEGWLPGGRRCELTVIACQSLGRAFVPWAATGLPWVPTSPHIPHPETAAFYAATGIVGELPTLSIGVGYTLPFELAGAPGIAPAAMARRLEARNFAGVRFRPATWTPFYAAFKGVRCGGVQIYLDDPARAPLTRINFEILDALRALDRGRALFVPAAAAKMFDLVCGTDRVRKAFTAGAGADDLWAQWNADRDAFLRRRQPYLLYR